MSFVAVRLIEVPYDSGHRDQRMGSGPLTLADAGAGELLRSHGHEVREQLVEADPAWRSETVTAFQLHRAVAKAAKDARALGEFPLLLSGNCNTSVGMLAGGLARGLAWFDAHGDLNTPETTPSGFLDGQALAMATGRCWQAAIATVSGFTPVADDAVLLVGARDFDQAEQETLRRSAIATLAPADARAPGRCAGAVDSWAERIDGGVHVHVDLDVYDPSIGPANAYAVPGGLLTEDVRRVVTALARRVPLVSATLASFDPRGDRDNGIRDAALDLLVLLAGLATVTDR
ncbi:MAG TPA: arginase family protein [Pseudonocardiaceae bacterium]|jgi:arginase|nr:arginase family protein [Pseudonocardiaceae bacterium]